MKRNLPIRLAMQGVPRSRVDLSLLACRLLAELRARRHAETPYVSEDAIQAATEAVQHQVPRASPRQLDSAMTTLVERGYVVLPDREGR
jgi:hypothetical protein